MKVEDSDDLRADRRDKKCTSGRSCERFYDRALFVDGGWGILAENNRQLLRNEVRKKLLHSGRVVPAGLAYCERLGAATRFAHVAQRLRD